MSSRLLAALSLAALAACNDAQPCPRPLEECGGTCVDIQSDRLNCGSCQRPCGAGLACVGGACTNDPNTPCASRRGGAFVTLGSCGAAVKLWVDEARQEFITRAGQLLVDPASAGPNIPSVAVQADSDCDAQWSWRGSELSVEFVASTPVLAGGADCAVCPADIESAVSTYVLTVGRWCPVGARVLAVDVRP
jgi:hypothetical protein